MRLYSRRLSTLLYPAPLPSNLRGSSKRCFSSVRTSREPKSVLVTIPASSYAEKARWALRAANIPFTEEKWAPLMVYTSTVPKGGRSVPLLTVESPNVTLTDSADIVAFCAKTSPELHQNDKAKELEKFYDAKLGPHVRRFAYFVWFQDGTTSRKIMSAPLDGFIQRSLTSLAFPLLRLVLQRAMKINEKNAERSWTRIEELVKDAEKKLGNGPIGSRFLAGDTFSSADITFCSHVSLLVLPPEHEFIAPYISLGTIQHPVHRKRLEDLQRSKIGQYVLWCYKNKRPEGNKLL